MNMVSKALIAIIFAFALSTLPTTSKAEVDVTVDIGLPTPPLVAVAPPAIPVYRVPAPPEEGVIWIPGYWHWNEWGYYWVPGTWVWPPAYGMLWTPGYWAWAEGNFLWHEGYWGPHVGFYGGINYGGGYNGVGFTGGQWGNGKFAVNRSITNINNITIKNVNNYSNAGFNGGPGGTHAAPTKQQQMADKERHMPLTSE